jgi:adenine-specific DNA methylase
MKSRSRESFPTGCFAGAELSVRGDGEDFGRSMVDIYRNFAQHMPKPSPTDVMFTDQNPAVWADLRMILWAAGLKATAAWTISTETAAPLTKDNYVQRTFVSSRASALRMNPDSSTRSIRWWRTR